MQKPKPDSSREDRGLEIYQGANTIELIGKWNMGLENSSRLKKQLGRGQTAEARRTTVLQPVEQKPHSQKDGQDEKAEGYVRDEGTR